MKISLFCVFGLICLAGSHPTNKKSNPVLENELDELELLLRQKLRQETRANGQNLYEEEKRKLEQEREIEEEDEEKDTENEEERANGQNLYEEEKRKLEQEREIEEDEEKDTENEEEYVDPDSSLEHLLEGMIIEENGKQHKVQGLHPEKSAKTYGDSHDTHKLLPKQQRDLANGKGRKRNFITDTTQLWHKNVIPYKIFNMSSSSITVINQAIQQFTDTTCVRWVPEDTAGSYGLNHQNVVYFINEQGCWSYVGNVGQNLNPRNIQQISLQEPGCVSLATTVHEMLHAMGGQHEQSRSDRDNYVQIEWNNVQGGTGNYNMQKLSTQDNNPYDAESSMQYALYAFSTNGQKTIVFRDQRLEFLADTADGLEFYDIQDVTDAYHCADHCTNPPACENGGFVNFQCTCVCPDGLTGATCTDTVSNSDTCGGVITLAQGEEKFIQSPNYPSNYPTGLECTWLIKGATASLVRASVEYMDIATGAACYHWLEYRYNLLGQIGPKRCGTNFNAGAEFWDSTADELGNVMMIKFNSNQFSNNAGTTGFRLKVQLIGSGCVVNPCAWGTCVSADGTSAYTCTCDPGFSGQHCDVLSASSTIGCSFEYGEKCFLDNDSGDQFDWSSGNGETPSSGTGPSQAHGGYQYFYTEVSSPRVQGDKAVLVNNVVNIPSGPRCLSFYYHMQGSSIGTLNVYTEGQNVAKSNVFTISGQQGNNWLKGEVDVQAMDNLKIYFEGVRGNSWAGDIALDDILLTPGTCAAPATVAPTTAAPTTVAPTTAAPTTAAPTTVAPTTAAPTTVAPTNAPTTTPVSGMLSCTFEPATSCFMVDSSDDDFDWTTRTGSTPSSNTGPTQADEGSHYKYIEVSSPRSNNDEATLVSTTSLTASDYCLIFSYHMFGSSSMGDLVIATGDSSPDNEVFRESGNLGNQWNQGIVDFTGGQNMKLFITANRGSTWKGDIAIDNLQLHNDVCSTVVSSCSTNPCQNGGTCTETTTKRMAAGYTCSCLAGFTGTECELKDLTTVTESTCGFENGECVFENDEFADFNWEINDGTTPSSGTGPSSAYEGTYYIYMEASSPRVDGDTAILSTAQNKLASLSTYCLQFYYHMLGNPDTLMVDFGERYSQGSTVWSVSGDQGDQWNYQQVEIDATTVNDPVVSIAAVRGSSWKGDIAVDSLVFKMGSCPATPCSSSPCKNGGSCQDAAASFVCVCASGWTGPTCETISVPLDQYTCDFEDGETCIFVDSSQDDFDWTRRTGSTPSSGTGPDNAESGTYYMYTEVSSPRSNGDVARLTTFGTTLQPSTYCLSLSYHMKGSPGSLSISAGDSEQQATEVWHQSGHQDDGWMTAFVDIPAFATPVIIIDGSRGQSYKGDIAIDNLLLIIGSCPSR